MNLPASCRTARRRYLSSGTRRCDVLSRVSIKIISLAIYVATVRTVFVPALSARSKTASLLREKALLEAYATFNS
jgi:hypothetical protein